MAQKVITVRDEMMEKIKVQLLGGGGIDFPEEMRFQGSPKGSKSSR